MPINKAIRMDDGRIMRGQARNCAKIIAEEAIAEAARELKDSGRDDKFTADVIDELVKLRIRITKSRHAYWKAKRGKSERE